jgi:flavin reductase (DIM6/NTAB) family NADH-FMN oxidoreductase RutF
LLLKKFEGLICYLKNLKDQSITNMKFKGPMIIFCLKNIIVSRRNQAKLGSRSSWTTWNMLHEDVDIQQLYD